MLINNRTKYKNERGAFGKYVTIRRLGAGRQVTLKIGVQSFRVGLPQDTHADADWLKSMLCSALSQLFCDCLRFLLETPPLRRRLRVMAGDGR